MASESVLSGFRNVNAMARNNVSMARRKHLHQKAENMRRVAVNWLKISQRRGGWRRQSIRGSTMAKAPCRRLSA